MIETARPAGLRKTPLPKNNVLGQKRIGETANRELPLASKPHATLPQLAAGGQPQTSDICIQMSDGNPQQLAASD